MTAPDKDPTRYQGRASIGSSGNLRAAALGVGIVALLLFGLPFAYRLGLERSTPPLASAAPTIPIPSPVADAPTPDLPQPSAGSGPLVVASAPSDVDRALEGIGVSDIFADHLDRGCDVEGIPKRSERSVTLGGRVEAQDHGGWVFTCRHEAGARTRYFDLASGITDVLQRIGTTFQGGTTFVGSPGGTIETRWKVRGDALKGEIELLTVATNPGTLKMIVLIDLSGTWQGGSTGG